MEDIAVRHLGKICIEIADRIERFRRQQDGEFVYLARDLSNGFRRADRDGTDQCARLKPADGRDGREERRAGGEPIINKNDGPVGQRPQGPQGPR